ncbi:hypothetical protein SAMN05421878_10875 [Actinobaculum suis]|uniref:Uncharacterized protein n=1 Tax=Actinobaculum suis TaxID=1657 RepID=A0A1G7CSL3_9ACTO|nr:hypothetical protein [Actinobaculum suis]MDY5152472.1 hypothetical protein [Actinobaculum suis]SDE41750.1 hypothetical protein SAMN05421878_10875 [Actinobaculum suis]
MSTPNDPYNAQSRRPLDDEDFLAPIEESVPPARSGSAMSAASMASAASAQEAISALEEPIFDEPADQQNAGSYSSGTAGVAGATSGAGTYGATSTADTKATVGAEAMAGTAASTSTTGTTDTAGTTGTAGAETAAVELSGPATVTGPATVVAPAAVTGSAATSGTAGVAAGTSGPRARRSVWPAGTISDSSIAGGADAPSAASSSAAGSVPDAVPPVAGTETVGGTSFGTGTENVFDGVGAPAPAPAPASQQAAMPPAREYATLGQAAGIDKPVSAEGGEQISPYVAEEIPYTPPAAPSEFSPAPESEAQSRMSQWATVEGGAIALPEEPKGRGWTHVWVTFVSFLLVVVGWYLISDGMAGLRLAQPLTEEFLADPASAHAAGVSFVPLVELLGGGAALLLLGLLARRSSFAAQFFGVVFIVAGLLTLFVPALGMYAAQGWAQVTASLNYQIVQNITAHLFRNFMWGGFLIFGVGLFSIGFAAHGARRRGARRAEATTRREIYEQGN